MALAKPLSSAQSLTFLSQKSAKESVWKYSHRFFTTTSGGQSTDQPVLALRREESSVWERRAPLNPSHVGSLVKKGVRVLVQPSTRRAYSMPEYQRAGAIITDDIDEANVIIGMYE